MHSITELIELSAAGAYRQIAAWFAAREMGQCDITDEDCDYIDSHEAWAMKLAKQYAAGAIAKLGPIRQSSDGSSFTLMIADGNVLSPLTINIRAGADAHSVWGLWGYALEEHGLCVVWDAETKRSLDVASAMEDAWVNDHLKEYCHALGIRDAA